MTDHNSSLVNLSIPKEVTQPIVAAKIQEAVLAALGGADKIIEGIMHQICHTKVNPKDGKVSTYNSDNTVLWMDYHVTKIIEKSVEEELKKQLEAGALPMKESLIKMLQSKNGQLKYAEAILAGLTDTFKGQSNYPKITIEFTKKESRGW